MQTSRNLMFVVVLALTTALYAEQYHKATGWVNDFAQVLSKDQGEALNSELTAFEKKTTVEIAVVTVPWLDGQSVEDYTKGLFREWGVGKKGKNNGVVFLVAVKERKMRIQTASGSLEVLSNAKADEIRDNAIIPRFKEGNLPQGIIDGTRAIMRTFDPLPAEAETNSAPPVTQPVAAEAASSNGTVILCIVGCGLALVIFFASIIYFGGRYSARSYVLGHIKEIDDKLYEAQKLAQNKNVKERKVQELDGLWQRFSEQERKISNGKKVDWPEIKDVLIDTEASLDSIVGEFNDQVTYAEKARREGPELLKKMPGIIAATEKKVGERKNAKRAMRHLQEAREGYEKAQQQSGLSAVDWIIIYELLNRVQSHCESAEIAHTHTSDDGWSHGSSSNDSSSSDSGFGFGDSSSGFGSGGGVDAGGGSSGSW